MSIAAKIAKEARGRKLSAAKRTEPLWKGPEQDGISYSLLSRFLVCRERFRLLVVEGLQPVERFYPPIDYGNMWHVCEEQLALNDKPGIANVKGFFEPLTNYCVALAKRYPYDQDAINHWYGLCQVQFPLYVDWWRKHPDVTGRTPLLQEQSFAVPYQLPSGRVIKLRGKWDSVDLIAGKDVYIQENKTKSHIDAGKLSRQLTFDLQTMIYVVALKPVRLLNKTHGAVQPLKGVRYNVIKRSQHKSVGSFTEKITEDIAAGRGREWFDRWKVDVSEADIARFCRECLDPILENLCDWWVWVSETHAHNPFDLSGRVNDTWAYGQHWRHPFGVYNVLDEGGSSELDEYLATGSEVGLQRTNNLFPEL